MRGIARPITSLAALALLASACSSTRHDADAEAHIARSVDVENAVAFRAQGGPLDEPAPVEHALSLAAALRAALATSPELQVALARVRVAQADADQASLLPNPVLDFVLRFPAGGGKTDIETSLGVDLLSLLTRTRRTDAAAQRLHAEAARAVTTALDVILDVQTRYASARALAELVPLIEARRVTQERLIAIARARLDAGEGARHEVTALEAERAQQSLERAQAARELALARVALAHAIGTPSAVADWELDAWAPPQALPAEEIRDTGAWIAAALDARPEVRALGWELSASGTERDLARDTRFQGASAGVDAERADDWSLGPALAVPLPVFDTGSVREERAQAVHAERGHALTQARRAVVEDVRMALVRLDGAHASYARLVEDVLPALEQRLRESEQAWNAGVTDVGALLFAEIDLHRARARRVELARELTTAHDRLERAVGGPASLRALAGETPKAQP